MPVDVTENSIRVRVKDPGGFQEGSFRTIDISKEQGIQAVIGKLQGETSTTVQAYIFDKDKWTPEKAEAWVKEHEAKKTDEPMIITNIKAVTDWVLDVLAIPFGGPHGGKDAQGEYFDKNTNLHLDKFPAPMIVYYHGFEPDGKPQGDPDVIGKAVGREVKEDGVWVRVLLDKASEYAKRVWEAAKKGLAKGSSGTVEHLARVNPDGRIINWPFVELAVFDTDKNRKPANAYAVALPAIKAIYAQAGKTWPEFLDDEDFKAKSKGSNDQSDNAELEPWEIRKIERIRLKAQAFLTLED